MDSFISKKSLITVLSKHGYASVTNLGKGGYGEVYVAHHEQTDQQYAVKVTQFNGLTQEIDALKSIWHPNIIYLYDVFVEKNVLFLVFEYCPGGPLSAKTPLPKREFFTVCAELIAAVNACHSQKLAHLDIKPSNILIDKYGRAKLADFGISQIIQDGVSQQFKGTPAFVAPEILRKAPYDPFKADIWSLGMTLYKLATGELPGLFASRVFRSGLLHSVLPTKIAKVILQMIEPNPAKRIKLEDIDMKLLETTPTCREGITRLQTGRLPARRGAFHEANLGRRRREIGKAASLFVQPTFPKEPISQNFESR
jgi:serine/threonine protein kinase